MRLTLRTLLAYRDGVLSPAETGNLHQRIKQTEVASNLLRRIEALVQRKQLLAPKVNSTGLGGDANTVAEYLDDTLASDQVPEFERICIAESDLKLAELAHCHQLLAEALNSQVQVPPSLRALAISLTNADARTALAQRLKNPNAGLTSRSIAATDGRRHRLDQAHAESLVIATEAGAVTGDASSSNGKLATQTSTPENAAQRSQVQAPMVTSGGGSIRPQGLDLETPQLAHEVPEYLVGQRSGGWRMPLSIGAMLALLAVLVWQALGPFESVKQMFVASNATPSSDRALATPKETEHIERKPAADGLFAPRVDPSASSKAASEAASSDLAANLNEQLSIPLNTTGPESQQSKVANGDPPVPTQAVSPQAVSPQILLSPQVVKHAVEGQSISSACAWMPTTPDDLTAVLLVQSPAADGTTVLSRLQAGAAISAEATIVVPPSMRPTLDLTGSCLWTVCGPTLMKPAVAPNVAPSVKSTGVPTGEPTGDASEEPKSGQVSVSTSLCRALCKAGPHGREFTVIAPAGSLKLQFEDATSMASLEAAYRPVAHAALTDKLAYKPVLIVVAIEGRIHVTPLGNVEPAKTAQLDVGEGVALIDAQPLEFELGEIPGWYRAENERPLDALAAADMHKLLSGGELASELTLMCVNRRPETAALGIQTSILLGKWSDFAGGFLNNELMRSHWVSTLSLAEQMLVASERNAELLRQEFEATHPGRGDSLYTLFVGSVDGKQGKESLTKLIELLGSSQLDERVLALQRLRQATGKDLGFQPSFPNRAALQLWRREIASNRLSLLVLGDPLWEAKRPVLDQR